MSLTINRVLHPKAPSSVFLEDLAILFVLGVCLLGLPRVGDAAIRFIDTTNTAGFIPYSGESYGASWGDLNSDGFPDLFINRHRNMPALYVNQGDGTFTDIGFSISTWTSDPDVDMHGGSWNDFDNDGEDDLYISAGRFETNQFFVNNAGVLSDETATYDPDVEKWRARLPIWFDFTGDGYLDFLMSSGQILTDNIPSPNLVFEQVPGGFVDRTADTGVACMAAQQGYLVDVSGDSQLEFLCGSGSFPQGIYGTSSIPFQDLTSSMPKTSMVQDVAVADFDGNLKMDFFFVRGKTRLSEAVQTAEQQAEAQIIVEGQHEKGFRFTGTGDITVDLASAGLSANDVRIGAGGWSPTQIPFTLAPSDENTWDMATHDPATDAGLYIGYDPGSSEWEFRVSPGKEWIYTWIGVMSTASVQGVTTFGLEPGEDPVAPVLMQQTVTGFQNETQQAGLSSPIQCISAGAADFDNDMDVDLYVVCRKGLTNVANRLYENLGDGTFALVPGAGGAEGVTGAGNAGTGENVAIADYDMDGFLDLVVTNGLNMQPVGAGGPDQLFRNLGNSNHWVELDLQGVVSNRSGIGAKIFASAGGVTQLREQGGGYHRWAQHHQRVHFGLGANTSVDIEIHWPSGEVQSIVGLAADSVYDIVEGSGPKASVSDVVVDESAGTATLTVRLSHVGDKPVTVDYATDDGSATAPADYAASSDTLNFPIGSTEQSFDVTIVDDADTEVQEDFGVVLSNFVNALPGKINAAVTINDDDTGGGGVACGAPTYDQATEKGLFLWRDCDVPGTSMVWHLRMTAGGSATSVKYRGSITSVAATLRASGYSTESNDVLDSLPGDGYVDYFLKTIGVGEDGFQVDVPSGADVCFDPTTLMPPDVDVYLGAARQVMYAPFDLATLGGCAPSVSVADLSVPESDAAHVATVTITLSSPVSESVSVDYATSDGTATAGADYAATSGAAVITAGNTSTTVDIPVSNDGLIEGDETLTVTLSNPQGALLDQSTATVTIVDDDDGDTVCGPPSYNPATETGLFLWRECDAPGPDNVWHLRMTAGGSVTAVKYRGSINSTSAVLSTSGYGIESNDVLDSLPSDGYVDYFLKTIGVGEDGFEVDLPSGADVCFDPTTLMPPDVGVYLGAEKQNVVALGAFDLATLATCTP